MTNRCLLRRSVHPTPPSGSSVAVSPARDGSSASPARRRSRGRHRRIRSAPDQREARRNRASARRGSASAAQVVVFSPERLVRSAVVRYATPARRPPPVRDRQTPRVHLPPCQVVVETLSASGQRCGASSRCPRCMTGASAVRRRVARARPEGQRIAGSFHRRRLRHTFLRRAPRPCPPIAHVGRPATPDICRRNRPLARRPTRPSACRCRTHRRRSALPSDPSCRHLRSRNPACGGRVVEMTAPNRDSVRVAAVQAAHPRGREP